MLLALEIDSLAILSVSLVGDFWQDIYHVALDGTFINEHVAGAQ